jgi:hypothetical protein
MYNVLAQRKEEIASLKEVFERDLVCVIPQLIEARLHPIIESFFNSTLVQQSNFEHPESIGREIRFANPKMAIFFDSIFNNPEFLAMMSELTGQSLIRSFGRSFEIQPGDEFQWHGDASSHIRSAGFSLNLSPNPYEGGEFEIRPKADHSRTTTIKTGYLDLHLFKVNNVLYEHRICEVKGSIPRRSFSGWFSRTPD